MSFVLHSRLDQVGGPDQGFRSAQRSRPDRIEQADQGPPQVDTASSQPGVLLNNDYAALQEQRMARVAHGKSSAWQE